VVGGVGVGWGGGLQKLSKDEGSEGGQAVGHLEKKKIQL